jgi:hypothetical protein
MHTMREQTAYGTPNRRHNVCHQIKKVNTVERVRAHARTHYVCLLVTNKDGNIYIGTANKTTLQVGAPKCRAEWQKELIYPFTMRKR